MTGRTLARVPRRRVRLAHRGVVARCFVAHFRGFARYFGHGVGFETGRALAQRLVAVRETNGVHAAGALVAEVRARVRLSVANLRLRAIVVVHARHFPATVRVVRIAGKRTGRTLALGHVIVGNAHRVRAAHRMVADGSARFQLGRGVF